MPKGVREKTGLGPSLKNWRLGSAAIAITGVVLVAIFIYQPNEAQEPKCGVYRSDKTVVIKNKEIEAEVAQTPAEWQKGLSGRPCIGSDQGMLFVFDKPGQYPFWMKDMKFPIDIVWIDASHKVIGIDINVDPSTYPDAFVSKTPAQYVLELPANRSKALNITLGTPVNL